MPNLRELIEYVRNQRDSSPIARLLVDAFEKLQSTYWAELPYNLNWIPKTLGPVESFLKRYPIVVADVGASGGDPQELVALKNYCSYIVFEPDPDAYRKLAQQLTHEYAGFRALPYYIGPMTGALQFHLYKTRAHSSSLRPNRFFTDNFGTLSDIEETITVQSITLDSLLEKEKLPFPDVIKLDTQGTELEILKASPQALSKALLISTEVEFTEMYEGQALYHDIAAFLHHQGFELLYINRVFLNRKGYGGEARGQIAQGDALFGVHERRWSEFSPQALAKYAILLINYGHRDIAKQIVDRFPAVRALCPGISEYFQPYESDESRVLAMQQDKLLLWFLHERRTNKLDWDGDRSWPIR